MIKFSDVYAKQEPRWEGDDDNFDEQSDYNVLLDLFEFKILLQVDDKDYQGDSRVLFYDEKTHKFGFLVFGWGSCSGCDSLQACHSVEQVDELQEQIFNDITWFDSADKLLYYFKTKDWELEYCYHDEGEFKIFLEKAEKILMRQIVFDIAMNISYELYI